jgi:Nitroreductase family
MNIHPSSFASDQRREVPTPEAGFLREPSPAVEADLFGIAQALLESRQNVSPKRLVEPGPSPQQFASLMSLAAAAPDHGLLTPWRFIVVPTDQRQRLAEVFALALIDRDPGATLEQIESAREKAYRAPLVTSHRIPATCFRHIPASWTGAEEHLAGPQEWLDLVGLASSRGLAEGAAGGASLGAR